MKSSNNEINDIGGKTKILIEIIFNGENIKNVPYNHENDTSIPYHFLI